MASERDRAAAQMHREGLSYAVIADRLEFPDARAAHRGVARALADPVREVAAWSGVRLAEQDQTLCELGAQLGALLDEVDPTSRVWCRVFESLFAVTVRRCRLKGLCTHPWRCDQWWRTDVPADVFLYPQLEARRLERQARIPERVRARRVDPLAEVLDFRRVGLCAVPEDLVPASVSKLLTQRRAA